jgi:hypothetical protein
MDFDAMLELICNAVWLTTGAVLTWRLIVLQQNEPRLALRLVTVACLLLVLFPVISLSDDLSTPEAALMDLSHSGDQAPNSGVDHNSSVAVALATSAAAIRLHFLHFAEPAQHQNRTTDVYFLSSDALRAPPVSL